MKSFKILLLLSFLMTVLVSCDNVPVGHVGIKIYKLGGSKGVDSEVLTPGRCWIGWNEDLFVFPTFQQNKVWTQDVREDSPTDESFTFQTSDAQEVNCDIGISYQFAPDKITKVFEKYRKGPDEITNIILRNGIRDAFNVAASKYPIERITDSGKVRLIKEVKQAMTNRFTPEGIIVTDVSYVSAFRLPANIKDAINQKNAAKQKAEQREGELRQSIAEAEKKIAEARGDSASAVLKAQGDAKANIELARSITPNLVEYIKAKTWNGSYATTVLGKEPTVIVDTK